MEVNVRLKVRVGPQGRIVIPAALREELGVSPGQELVARVEDGRLVLERREDVVRRLKGRFAHVPAGRMLSEELIAERREEAKLEAEREEELENERGTDGGQR
jgi:AbrB family looped-hinge helix DNA binding protein